MPHTPLRQALRRPWPGTRRGLCLWFFSLAFVALGSVNYILTEPPETTRQALVFAFNIGPPVMWGTFMAVAGIIAFYCSYCHFGRDRYGFILLSTFCGGWGTVYICGFLFYDAGLRAISGSVIWFLFAGVLSLLAGFPNLILRQPPIIRRQGTTWTQE